MNLRGTNKTDQSIRKQDLEMRLQNAMKKGTITSYIQATAQNTTPPSNTGTVKINFEDETTDYLFDKLKLTTGTALSLTTEIETVDGIGSTLLRLGLPLATDNILIGSASGQAVASDKIKIRDTETYIENDYLEFTAGAGGMAFISGHVLDLTADNTLNFSAPIYSFSGLPGTTTQTAANLCIEGNALKLTTKTALPNRIEYEPESWYVEVAQSGTLNLYGYYSYFESNNSIDLTAGTSINAVAANWLNIGINDSNQNYLRFQSDTQDTPGIDLYSVSRITIDTPNLKALNLPNPLTTETVYPVVIDSNNQIKKLATAVAEGEQKLYYKKTTLSRAQLLGLTSQTVAQLLPAPGTNSMYIVKTAIFKCGTTNQYSSSPNLVICHGTAYDNNKSLTGIGMNFIFSTAKYVILSQPANALMQNQPVCACVASSAITDSGTSDPVDITLEYTIVNV